MTNNPNGRPKGTRNRITEQLRDSIGEFLNEEFEKLKVDFKSLSTKDKIKVFTDLLQYSLPKLQAVQMDSDFEKMTDEDLDEIIERLKQQSNAK